MREAKGISDGRSYEQKTVMAEYVDSYDFNEELR